MNILDNAPVQESGLHATRKGSLGVAVVCIGANGLLGMLFVALSPALPQIAAEYGKQGAGALATQMVFSLSAVTVIVGALFTGMIAERVGRRSIMLASLIGYAMAGVGGMFAPDLLWFGIARALIGLVSGMLLTTSYGIIGEHYEGSARERMLGFGPFFSSVIAMGLLISGGIIADHFGWRAMFLLFGASLLLVPFAYVALPRGRAERKFDNGGWSEVAKLWPLYSLNIVLATLVFMVGLQSPFLLSSRGIVSTTQVGSLLSITSVVAGLSSFGYGYMRKFMDFSAMLAAACLLGGAGMIVTGMLSQVTAYVAAAILIGLGVGLIEPTMASETLSRSPERLHDRAMGINIAAIFLGQFLNPLMMGGVSANWGIAPAFTIVGVGFVTIGCLFLFSRTRAAAGASGGGAHFSKHESHSNGA